jgi:hypothetical protein
MTYAVNPFGKIFFKRSLSGLGKLILWPQQRKLLNLLRVSGSRWTMHKGPILFKVRKEKIREAQLKPQKKRLLFGNLNSQERIDLIIF